MPIYTYKCKNCGKVTEKFKSMNSNGSEKCEHCRSETSRVFSPAGIIFKGSGFYTTDYKSSSSRSSVSDAGSSKVESSAEKGSVKPADSKGNKTDSKNHTSSTDTSSRK